MSDNSQFEEYKRKGEIEQKDEVTIEDLGGGKNERAEDLDGDQFTTQADDFSKYGGPALGQGSDASKDVGQDDKGATGEDKNTGGTDKDSSQADDKDKKDKDKKEPEKDKDKKDEGKEGEKDKDKGKDKGDQRDKDKKPQEKGKEDPDKNAKPQAGQQPKSPGLDKAKQAGTDQARKQAADAGKKAVEEAGKQAAKEGGKVIAKEGVKKGLEAGGAATGGVTTAIGIGLEVLDILNNKYVRWAIIGCLSVIALFLLMMILGVFAWFMGGGPGGSSFKMPSSINDQIAPVNDIEDSLNENKFSDDFKKWVDEIKKQNEDLKKLGDKIGKVDTLEETDKLIDANQKLADSVKQKIDGNNNWNNEENAYAQYLKNLYSDEVKRLANLREFNRMFECLLIKARTGGYIEKQYLDHNSFSKRSTVPCQADDEGDTSIPPALEFANQAEKSILLPLDEKEAQLNKDLGVNVDLRIYRTLFYIYKVLEQDTKEYDRYVKDGPIQQATTPYEIKTFCYKNIEDNPERCDNPTPPNFCGALQTTYNQKVNSDTVGNLGNPYKKRAHMKIWLGSKAPLFSDEKPTADNEANKFDVFNAHYDFKAMDIAEFGLYNERLDCTACKGLSACVGECVPPAPCCPLNLDPAKDALQPVLVRWQSDNLENNVINNLPENLGDNLPIGTGNNWGLQSTLGNLAQIPLQNLFNLNFSNFNLSDLAHNGYNHFMSYVGQQWLGEKFFAKLGLPRNLAYNLDWNHMNSEAMIWRIAGGYLEEAFGLNNGSMAPLSLARKMGSNPESLLNNQNILQNFDLPTNLNQSFNQAINNNNQSEAVKYALANLGQKEFSRQVLNWPDGVLDTDNLSLPSRAPIMGQKIISQVTDWMSGSDQNYLSDRSNADKLADAIRYTTSPIKVTFDRDFSRSNAPDYLDTTNNGGFTGQMRYLGIKLSDLEMIPQSEFESLKDSNSPDIFTKDNISANQIYYVYPRIDARDLVSGNTINSKYNDVVGQFKILESTTKIAEYSRQQPIQIKINGNNLSQTELAANYQKAYQDKFSVNYQTPSNQNMSFPLLTKFGGNINSFNALNGGSADNWSQIGESVLASDLTGIDFKDELNEFKPAQSTERVQDYTRTIGWLESLKDNNADAGLGRAVNMVKTNGALQEVFGNASDYNMGSNGEIINKQFDLNSALNTLNGEKGVTSLGQIKNVSSNLSQTSYSQLSLDQWDKMISNPDSDSIIDVMSNNAKVNNIFGTNNFKNELSNILGPEKDWTKLSEVAKNQFFQESVLTDMGSERWNEIGGIMDQAKSGQIKLDDAYSTIGTSNMLYQALPGYKYDEVVKQMGGLQNIASSGQSQQLLQKAISTYGDDMNRFFQNNGFDQSMINNFASGDIKNTLGMMSANYLNNYNVLPTDVLQNLFNGNLSYGPFINSTLPQLSDNLLTNPIGDMQNLGQNINPITGGLDGWSGFSDLTSGFGSSMLFTQCKQKIARDNIIHLTDILLSYDKDKNSLDYFGIKANEDGETINEEGQIDYSKKKLLYNYYFRQLFSDFHQKIVDKIKNKSLKKFDMIWGEDRDTKLNVFVNDCQERENDYFKKCVEAVHVGF